MEILIYITCFIVIAYVAYSVLRIKSKSPGDDILSSQITNLSERFAIIEEAAKQINSTQNTIDETFKNFQHMLDDKQERGAFAEQELEKLLRDRLPQKYLKFQKTLSNGKRVDCLIDFGDHNSRIGVDSKFVLDNFKKIKNSTSDQDIKKYKKLFEIDVLKNVKKISDDYIIAGETAPHAIMFVRSENVFKAIEESDSNLIQKAREKNVLIVSPTYLWGLLNTLRVFLRDSDMSRKTQVFVKEIGLIGKDIERLADRTADIEKKFNLISDQFRNVKVSADKIQSRAEKLQQIENVESEVEELEKK
ncbi:MAG: DNA recombination protein RmuC [Candidatus Pelagibacter sp.]|nr:DNA recombination protein RmuC [Candidatus Pelagibacter sp.]|tara:strand:+ start:507 stop:1421 length:915 start_codon:yes stop_codon:yes gene_type:complete